MGSELTKEENWIESLGRLRYTQNALALKKMKEGREGNGNS